MSQSGSDIGQKKRKESKEKRKQINVRLPLSTVERMERDREILNLSQADFLTESIEKRSLVHRRDDGIQIALLKSLHTLNSLLKSDALTAIDRQKEAQELFDHLYETFFRSSSEPSHQAGEVEDEKTAEPGSKTVMAATGIAADLHPETGE